MALVAASGQRVVMVSTDDLALRLEREQEGLGEGPYLDAQTSLVPVTAPDLDPSGAASARWPVLAARAQGLGARALFAFPIRVSTLSVGTLGLYRRASGPLGSTELGAALTAVDQIAVALGDLESWTDESAPDQDDTDHDRRIAVAGSAHVHQAAGMVMIQAGVTVLEAMALLRATAFAEDTPLADLARDVVERRRRLGTGGP